MEQFDILIIGAGIAGASAAYTMSHLGQVAILEMEDQTGTHATGRSAAFFSQTYGNATIRSLTTGSKHFLREPPEGFSDHDLLRPSGALYIGRDDQREKLDRHHQAVRSLVHNVERCNADFVLERVPVLRAEYVAGGVWEPDSQAIDVHELLTSYVKGARTRGASLLTKCGVTGLRRQQGRWIAETQEAEYSAPIVVNAAGAWADQVAAMAGLPPLGLTPMRRTVCAIQPPQDLDVSSWPLVLDIDENFYFKPDNRQLWLSPADETPMTPCDAYPDDMDIAVAVDRFETATTIGVKRILHSWAGLRTFAPDRTPIAGFDPLAEGFFWLAGQGGYGIQTSPAMARLAAGLIAQKGIPNDLTELGIQASQIAPDRFR